MGQNLDACVTEQAGPAPTWRVDRAARKAAQRRARQEQRERARQERRRAPKPAQADGTDTGRPAGIRGFVGPGRGRSTLVQPPPEFLGTNVQVCGGFWPFSVGAGTPVVGVPIGHHMHTGATVSCDPIPWFQDAQLIGNPSTFILGQPGLGKSTVVRRMALGLSAFGTIPMVLGDLKPEHLETIRAVGGEVLPLGRNRGHLNPLDPGDSMEAATRLTGSAREELIAGNYQRRLTAIAALVTIVRHDRLSDREGAVLERALAVLERRTYGQPGLTASSAVRAAVPPLLSDLIRIIREGPDEVRQVSLDRGKRDRYDDVVENLEASLVALVEAGNFGSIFARQSTTRISRDRPLAYDVSSIDDTEDDLQAAVLLACWSQGFAAVEVSQALAAAGLEPERHYFLILDELWRALQAGQGMVQRVDALTRLNRQRGVGLALITHSMDDLLSLPTEEDRRRAAGFVERAGMVICFGLPARELDSLSRVVSLSAAERDLLTSWTSPPAWDPAGRETSKPGRGKCLIKVGGRPGLPVQTTLTHTEAHLHDTDLRWHAMSRLGRQTGAAGHPDSATSDLSAAGLSATGIVSGGDDLDHDQGDHDDGHDQGGAEQAGAEQQGGNERVGRVAGSTTLSPVQRQLLALAEVDDGRAWSWQRGRGRAGSDDREEQT